MPLLQAVGDHVYAPTMIGLGERRHMLPPEVGLGVHIAGIVNV
jgi:hypothetical protein